MKIRLNGNADANKVWLQIPLWVWPIITFIVYVFYRAIKVTSYDGGLFGWVGMKDESLWLKDVPCSGFDTIFILIASAISVIAGIVIITVIIGIFQLGIWPHVKEFFKKLNAKLTIKVVED